MDFCAGTHIKEDVETTLALARQCFAVVGNARYEIIEDPECQEHYLAIHVNVSDAPEEAFAQSESFLDAFVASVDPSRQRRISLVYHSA